MQLQKRCFSALRSIFCKKPRFTHALPVLLSFFFLFSTSRIHHYRVTPASVVLRMTRGGGGGLGFFYSFVADARSTHIALLRCIPRYGGQVEGVRTNSNTRRRGFLCREVMPVRLRKHSSKILLEMDSYRLQTFARSFWARRAQISIPAGTGRRGQTAFQVYIYVFILVPVRYSCY